MTGVFSKSLVNMGSLAAGYMHLVYGQEMKTREMKTERMSFPVSPTEHREGRAIQRGQAELFAKDTTGMMC
jgi:hypothetical protein